MASEGENDRLAAAWQAGFDAASLALIMAANDAQKRGHAAAVEAVKPVPNPYHRREGGSDV